jgi:hypothetical protein
MRCAHIFYAGEAGEALCAGIEQESSPQATPELPISNCSLLI